MRQHLLAVTGLALLLLSLPGAPAQAQSLPGAAPSPAAALPPPPPPGGPRGPGAPPPPPSPAAHVRLERGDAHLDVKCADGESTQSCAATVGGLLDKLAAMPAAPPARN